MPKIRLTERRKLIALARERAESAVREAIRPVFHRQFKRLERFLRKSNLRKKLGKIKIDAEMPVEQASLTRVELLFKAPSPPKSDQDEWEKWKEELLIALLLGLFSAVDEFGSVENRIATSRGHPELTYDPGQVIEDYQRRIGKPLGNIAGVTLTAIQRIISDWYQTEDPFSTLIDRLDRYFNDVRIDVIASTEAGNVLSQIIHQEMVSYGLMDWYWDHKGEDIPCTNPITIAGRSYNGCKELNGKYFKLGDPMPPEAAHPNCHCLPTIVGY